MWPLSLGGWGVMRYACVHVCVCVYVCVRERERGSLIVVPVLTK